MSVSPTSIDPEAADAEAREKHVTIVVNGQKKTVPSRTVSWDEVVDLAYPGERGDENFTFVVTYSDAQHSKSGILEQGGSVEAKEEGTSFNVAKHRRS
jgi:ribosomal protein S4